MTMHPELEHAFDTGVSIQEVTEIFAKHYCGPKLDNAQFPISLWDWDVTHSSSEFWDNWRPLFRSLSIHQAKLGPIYINELSLNTHRALTRGVISWLCDSRRKSNIYLINESWIPSQFSEGYSRAAVVGKICSAAQRCGSVYARYCKILVNIDRLSAELAAAYPPYRHILTQILINYPEIHRLPQRALFKKLIHEPWKLVQHRHPGYITTPPVIVLSCNGSYVQEGLFRLICELGSPPHSSPLLWIISVGPKLKLPTQDLVEPFAPHYIKPPVCYNRVLEDARLILHDKFGTLRHKYNQMFDDSEVWPSDEQMAQLSRVVLGVFEFIDVIIQFVDWEGDGGPRSHLETFLGYMVDSPPPSDERRYGALDHFYIRALSSIPPDVFLDVKKAFNIIRWQPSLLLLPELLSLISFRFDTFLLYFYRLVSPQGYHSKRSCTIHFRRFVEDRNRSGQFYTPKSESCLQAYQAWLHFLSHSSGLHMILKPGVLLLSQTDLAKCAGQVWYLRSVAPSYLWDTREARANMGLLLRHFDSRCLAHNCDNISIKDFASLINGLYEGYEADDSPGIVRVEPASTLDRQFIDKCQDLAEPWDFEDDLSPTDPKYVLLGYGAETVLVVMASRQDYHQTMEGVGVEGKGGVTVYTSAMLDYM